MREFTCLRCESSFAAHRKRKYCATVCARAAGRAKTLARYHRLSAEGAYQRKPRAAYTRELACPVCGGWFVGKAAQKFCSRDCQFAAQVTHGQRRRSLKPKSEFRKRTEMLAKKAARGSSGGGLVWVNGPCVVCGATFTSPGVKSRYCSAECRSRNRQNRSYGLSWLDRMALFARDDWTCQICLERVDYGAPVQSDWYPTIDHIVPRSRGGGHEFENLRTAHRWCNSVRGDLTYYTDEDLAPVA